MILRRCTAFRSSSGSCNPRFTSSSLSFEDLLEQVKKLERYGDEKQLMEAKRMLDKARQLSEANPMLGHRGVRLGLTHPEIYEMQMTVVMEATAELVKEGVNVKPKIMTPQVAAYQEVKLVRGTVRDDTSPR